MGGWVAEWLGGWTWSVLTRDHHTLGTWLCARMAAFLGHVVGLPWTAHPMPLTAWGSLPPPLSGLPAGQSSYAHLIDTTIGLHLSDQFTFFLHHFLTTRLPPHPSVATSATTSSSTVPPAAGSQHPPSLQEVLDFIRGQSLASEVQVRTDLFPRRLADVAVTEFFGGGLMPAAPAAVRSPSQAAGSQPNKSEGGYGGGSVTGSSSTTVGGTAVQALLRAAVQAEQQAGAGARNAASRRQQEWHSWLPLQQSKHFEVLEAAGSGSQQLAKCGQQLASSAALLAVLWAVAVALSSWLLQGCEAI